MFSRVCFQMDLKLLLISTLLGVVCYSNAQKGKIFSVTYHFKTRLAYILYGPDFLILSDDIMLLMSACIVNVHLMMTTSPERERGRHLTDVIDQRSTLASGSIEDNGKDWKEYSVSVSNYH